MTCLRGRREGRLAEEGGPGGAHDSLALSRPQAPSSPPVGGTLQTPTLGGQHSPSAGLPRLTPLSELRVGVTRFQPQFLEATFPLDLAGVQAPPAGLSSHPGTSGSSPTHLPFPLLSDLKLQTALASEGAPPAPPALIFPQAHATALTSPGSQWAPTAPAAASGARGTGGGQGHRALGQLLTHK